MKFNQWICFGAVLVMVLLGCRRGDKPVAYAVHAAGAPVAVGEFLKMEQVQYYGGKVVLSTHGRMPMYQRYDTVSMIPEAFRAYTGVKVGDTVDYEVVLGEEMPLGAGQQVPKGGRVSVRSRILDILPDEQGMSMDMDIARRKLEATRRP